MDFRNKNYYLIGKDCADAYIPKQLKRYFKCKIRCHIYRYDNDIYTHCVSIDKNNAKRMVNYLKDKNIPYVQMFEPFERINYYTFKYVSEEEKRKREEKRNEYKRLHSLFNYLETKNKRTIDAISTQTNLSKENFFKYMQDALDQVYNIAFINPKTYNKFENELEEIKKECFIEKLLQSEWVEEDKIFLITKKNINL